MEWKFSKTRSAFQQLVVIGKSICKFSIVHFSLQTLIHWTPFIKMLFRLSTPDLFDVWCPFCVALIIYYFTIPFASRHRARLRTSACRAQCFKLLNYLLVFWPCDSFAAPLWASLNSGGVCAAIFPRQPASALPPIFVIASLFFARHQPAHSNEWSYNEFQVGHKFNKRQHSRR